MCGFLVLAFVSFFVFLVFPPLGALVFIVGCFVMAQQGKKPKEDGEEKGVNAPKYSMFEKVAVILILLMLIKLLVAR